MLQSNDQRSASFDAFFRSLDDDARIVFLDDATTQWAGIQSDEPNRMVSFIDCMENVWDLWRELPLHTADPKGSNLSPNEQAIVQVMKDSDRILRQREYFRMASE